MHALLLGKNLVTLCPPQLGALGVLRWRLLLLAALFFLKHILNPGNVNLISLSSSKDAQGPICFITLVKMP